MKLSPPSPLPPILFPSSNSRNPHTHAVDTVDNLFGKGRRKQQEAVDKGRRINPLNGAGSSCI